MKGEIKYRKPTNDVDKGGRWSGDDLCAGQAGLGGSSATLSSHPYHTHHYIPYPPTYHIILTLLTIPTKPFQPYFPSLPYPLWLFIGTIKTILQPAITFTIINSPNSAISHTTLLPKGSLRGVSLWGQFFSTFHTAYILNYIICQHIHCTKDIKRTLCLFFMSARLVKC